MHGVGVLCTTYGVGELRAINGISGAYAEHLPVIHLDGMPTSGVQAARRLIRHTLGKGEFDIFYGVAEPVVCSRAIMTPEIGAIPDTAYTAATSNEPQCDAPSPQG
ncbi:hypothetical protein [Paraburkholderia solitsugae]|uniref:hypothetical protein n=1 Tax=Paraburkholderia solitsugae TaxID=2675748 RepID=UPI002E2BA2C6|nr:hypothetical protein [Paraburkholderia solitsugae]